MATYSISALERQKKLRSPFVTLEGYVTFYRMSDYTPGKLRSAMTPVGTYFFWQGFNIEDIHNMLPPLQAFGSSSKNLTACEGTEAGVTLNGMAVQAGDDTSWFAAGHTPLLAFVDFLADPGMPTDQKDDIKNAANIIAQTVAIKDLHCTRSTIAGSDANLVTWNLTFIGGDVIWLSPLTMDLP